ncbi:MAG TPA: bifunctional riboflavin kinase/FAD synthetase [Mycobacteriales bacterium]|nr:bifunctional riboflavin kinase/FAD synthetase [Mycobacteriales bacterium]
MTVKSVVPIGVFDGVHRGHQLVLKHAVESARQRDARVVVVTFHPHPTAVLAPGHVPPMLVSLDRRIRLLRDHGADDVHVLKFDRELSLQTPQEFIEQVLINELAAEQIVVGHNFRFGHRAAGDAAMLRRYDLEVDDVALLTDGGTISSTLVRDFVVHGEVEAAASALGRLHLVEGPVVRGDARGRALGFPTANVSVDEGIAVPQDGVYAGWLTRAEGQRIKAAISVGTNPTFDGVERRVEAYAIDVGHELDLYDEHVVVEFASRLRGMERFASVDDLIEQMHRDVDASRSRLG